MAGIYTDLSIVNVCYQCGTILQDNSRSCAGLPGVYNLYLRVAEWLKAWDTLTTFEGAECGRS